MLSMYPVRTRDSRAWRLRQAAADCREPFGPTKPAGHRLWITDSRRPAM
jgi:hypothetical protein